MNKKITAALNKINKLRDKATSLRVKDQTLADSYNQAMEAALSAARAKVDKKFVPKLKASTTQIDAANKQIAFAQMAAREVCKANGMSTLDAINLLSQ